MTSRWNSLVAALTATTLASYLFAEQIRYSDLTILPHVDPKPLFIPLILLCLVPGGSAIGWSHNKTQAATGFALLLVGSVWLCYLAWHFGLAIEIPSAVLLGWASERSAWSRRNGGLHTPVTVARTC